MRFLKWIVCHWKQHHREIVRDRAEVARIAMDNKQKKRKI